MMAAVEADHDALRGAVICIRYEGPKGGPGAVRDFRQKFTLEDAIGSHACSLEALPCVQPMAFLSSVHSSYRFTLKIASKHCRPPATQIATLTLALTINSAQTLQA
jgi:hypothetical protein